MRGFPPPKPCCFTSMLPFVGSENTANKKKLKLRQGTTKRDGGHWDSPMGVIGRFARVGPPSQKVMHKKPRRKTQMRQSFFRGPPTFAGSRLVSLENQPKRGCPHKKTDPHDVDQCGLPLQTHKRNVAPGIGGVKAVTPRRGFSIAKGPFSTSCFARRLETCSVASKPKD